jgi:hypothetical protein
VHCWQFLPAWLRFTSALSQWVCITSLMPLSTLTHIALVPICRIHLFFYATDLCAPTLSCLPPTVAQPVCIPPVSIDIILLHHLSIHSIALFSSALSLHFGAHSGSYCATPSLTAVTGSCDAGYFCALGSTSATQAPCVPGFYCPAGSGAMVICPTSYVSEFSLSE